MGSPYVVSQFPEIQTYFCTFSNVKDSEISAVKAMFGEIPMTGHLPVTIPNIAAAARASEPLLNVPGEVRNEIRYSQSSVILAAAALTVLLAACSIQVDDKDKEAKKVDIQTPLANLKVDTSEASTDNGIPVYPGATPRPDQSGDKHRANVNIGAMGFGLKVIAAEYVTPDSPEKVKAFYVDKLKKCGNVLECRGTGEATTDRKVTGTMMDDGDKPVSCGGAHGDGWELKVGTSNNQHIVAIQPDGSGTRFGTVLVQIHGKEGTL